MDRQQGAPNTKQSRRRKVRLHKEGNGFVTGVFVFFLFIDVYLFYALDTKVPFYVVLPISLILLGLVVNFFRSPHRVCPVYAADNVISPADGKIVAIERVYEPEYLKRDCLMVSVFMSVFNVHANWYPVDGVCRYTRHHEGRFLAAYLPKSSVENERSTVVMETELGQQVLVRQIAGAVAKRIVTYAKEGEEYSVDDHMGFIKFGSRVDVYIPLDSEVLVKLDDVVQGNQTILAKLQ